MRVTQVGNFDGVRARINQTQNRLSEYQEKAATLKKLNRPSDDPVGTNQVLRVRTKNVNANQYFENAQLATAELSQVDSALEQMSELIMRAKEIALSQSSGASASEASRKGVSEEVKHLLEEAISLGNQKFGDRYLFGGFESTKPPVNETGIYMGDFGKRKLEIGEQVYVEVNVPGIEVFNTNLEGSRDYRAYVESKGIGPAPAMGENQNVFSELRSLHAALLSGDLFSIRQKLDDLDSVHQHLVTTRSKIGSRVKGIENALERIDRTRITHAKLESEISDADLSEVLSKLKQEEQVLKSTLQTSQGLLQSNLLDYLK